MNKVILMGRLTKDPDVRYTQGNEPMCIARYTLAVDRMGKKKEGQTLDGQRTDIWQPVDNQWTTSGQPMDNQWTA